MYLFIPELKVLANQKLNTLVLKNIQDNLVSTIQATPAYDKFMARVIASKMSRQEISEIEAEYVEPRACALFQERYQSGLTREAYLKEVINFASINLKEIKQELNQVVDIAMEVKCEDVFLANRNNRIIQSAIKVACGKISTFTKMLDEINDKNLPGVNRVGDSLKHDFAKMMQAIASEVDTDTKNMFTAVSINAPELEVFAPRFG